MAETKDFPTAAALSAITGSLVCEEGIGPVYEVLNWMTGDDLMTHQLPRASREAKEAMVAINPGLALSCEEAKLINHDNWRDYLAVWIARFGATVTLRKLSSDEHERIDPLSELAEKVHPSRIIVINPVEG